jgi:hypothetical protein
VINLFDQLAETSGKNSLKEHQNAQLDELTKKIDSLAKAVGN